jgi:NADPH-dependent 2,4-dienoyl-CoA reductase/sulfur reductase-like enzyme
MTERAPIVVIVGGGFAGLSAAQVLCKAPVQVLLIDRTNHPLFQPLLCQVDCIANPFGPLQAAEYDDRGRALEGTP